MTWGTTYITNIGNIYSSAGSLDSGTGSLHISLHTGSPGTSGTSNEVSGTNYSRQTVSFTESATGGGYADYDNDAIVTFSNTGSSWGLVTYIGIWTTADAFIGYIALDTSFTVGAGEIWTYAAGAMTIEIWTNNTTSTQSIQSDIGKAIFEGTNHTGDASYYMALMTSTSAEMTGTGYVRQAVTFTSNAQGVESTACVFTNSGASFWSTTTGMAIFIASTGGSMVWYSVIGGIANAPGNTLTVLAGDALDII